MTDLIKIMSTRLELGGVTIFTARRTRHTP